MGMASEDIANGLRAFSSSPEQNPGRHNWIDGLPFEVLLHWTDGAPALAELMETLDQIPPAGARHILFTAPGNRSDEWIRSLGGTAAGCFDYYHCTDMLDYLRGRKPGEVPSLLAEGLRGAGVAEDAILFPDRPDQSILDTLAQLEPGDRIAIVTGESDKALRQIEEYKSQPRR